MNAIVLGRSDLFVKGIASQTFRDSNGNIVGFDKIASDSAVATSLNLQEIAGGIGNKLFGMLPDTFRMTGTYTSQAFSLETRRLITGGKLGYNGISMVCEQVTAAANKLTITGTAVKYYTQPASDENPLCYVKQSGASEYMGTAYFVVDGVVTDASGTAFAANTGSVYEVFYPVQNASAQELAIGDTSNPPVVSVEQKYGVYKMQGGSTENGTFYGWMHIIVPKAILTGDAGVSANATTLGTTSGNWTAITDGEDALSCTSCVGAQNMAFYVIVPCASAVSEVSSLGIIGGGVSVKVNSSVQMPVVYIMPDGSTAQPVYTAMTYVSAAAATATVSDSGLIQGKAAGNTTVTATLTKDGGKTLTAVCNVTVTA